MEYLILYNMVVVEIYQLPKLCYMYRYATFEYKYALVAVSDGSKTFQIDQCLQKKLQNSSRFNHQSNMKRLSIMAS